METSTLQRVSRTTQSSKHLGDADEGLKRSQTEATTNLQLQDLSPNAILVEDEDLEDSPEPPDGGLSAWLQALMGHLVNINCMGYINSYGIFQAYYTKTFHLPSSTVAWTGSVQIFLLCFVGSFSGRALDAGYYRHVLLLGCFLQLLGIFSVSFADQYWQIFLAQGVCQGLGNGLVFCPTLSLVSTYFSKHRTSAISLMASGAATGGIIFPLIAEKCLPTMGFAWTVRIMGFVVLANVSVIITLARTRLPPRKSGPLFDSGAFKELPYLLFVIGAFFTLWPVSYAYSYMNIYATNVVHTSSSTSLTILLLLNAVGVPGRIIPAILADRFLGPLNTFIILCATGALLVLTWLAVRTFHGLIVFAVIYGLVNSGVQGISLGSMSSLTKDLSKMGTRVGMVLSIVAFANFSGAPIAGALIDRYGGQFTGFCIFGGSAMAFGVLILMGARYAETGWVWARKM